MDFFANVNAALISYGSLIKRDAPQVVIIWYWNGTQLNRRLGLINLQKLL